MKKEMSALEAMSTALGMVKTGLTEGSGLCVDTLAEMEGILVRGINDHRESLEVRLYRLERVVYKGEYDEDADLEDEDEDDDDDDEFGPQR